MTEIAIPDSDVQVLSLWTHGRSPHTQRAYRADAARFLAFARKPLAAVTLADLTAFSDSLAGLRAASRCRTLSAVKSPLAFQLPAAFSRCRYSVARDTQRVSQTSDQSSWDVDFETGIATAFVQFFKPGDGFSGVLKTEVFET